MMMKMESIERKNLARTVHSLSHIYLFPSLPLSPSLSLSLFPSLYLSLPLSLLPSLPIYLSIELFFSFLHFVLVYLSLSIFPSFPLSLFLLPRSHHLYIHITLKVIYEVWNVSDSTMGNPIFFYLYENRCGTKAAWAHAGRSRPLEQWRASVRWMGMAWIGCLWSRLQTVTILRIPPHWIQTVVYLVRR